MEREEEAPLPTLESARLDVFTRELARDLTTREKYFVLLCRTRQSGLFDNNSDEDAGHIAMSALYFGVYIGLLRFPSDFYDGVLMRQTELFDAWQDLLQADAEPYANVKLRKRVEGRHGKHRIHKDITTKNRPYGPLELGHKTFAQYDMMAAMLPFGDAFNEMLKIGGGERWDGKGAPTLLTPKGAQRLAEFVMDWIGKEEFLRLLEAHGRAQAEERRRYAVDFLVPHYDSTSRNELNKRYGLTCFATFVAVEENRAQLIRAVSREYNFTIDLREVRKVQDFKARLICTQCQVSSRLGLRELQSGRLFCSVNCQREAHRSK